MTSPRPDVVAAGAVVTRPGRQVLLVHRPKYDDWSFPKGKQDPGEHVTTTAVREVLEETGVEVRLGRPLLPQLYALSGGRAKKVHYWVGHVVGDDDVSGFVGNKEVDQLRWVDAEKARKRLTYSDDVAVLEDYLAAPRRTSAVVVVRHGRAVKRKSWSGDEARRPLTKVGREQARAIAPLLHAFGVATVVTSPSTRCAQTVKPYADEQVLPLACDPGLSEEQWTAGSVAAVATHLLGDKRCGVVCSHRPVLPSLLDAFGVHEEALAPGELVVLHHRKGRIRATERYLAR